MMRTILIMAGGTGGHVFPGLAVADCLKAAGWCVVWLGTQSGMETTLVKQRGYKLELINFSGLRGKNALTWLLLPLRVLHACRQSTQIISRVRPDVVLGMGGYPAFPGGMMASLLNKPLLIHEQNSVAGMTNKILAKLADKILLGFPGAIKNNNHNIIFVGNPVRSEISQLDTPVNRFANRYGKLKLLIVGGSLGAHALNSILPQAFKLMPKNLRPMVTHQTGSKDLRSLQKTYADIEIKSRLVAFIENMAMAYADCDLVLCRAGALTISELSAAGVASILVPYPYAVDDHQTRNAIFLVKNNAAILLPQQQLTPQNVANLLLKINREKLLKMAIAARKLAKPDATQLVAQACMKIASV